LRIQIAPEIFTSYPGYARHVLIAEEVDNSAQNAELSAMLIAAQEALRGDASFTDLAAHPRIASWRGVFEKFGTNPNRCPPSIANLIKRVRAGKDLPYINSLVCIFNIISMKYILPAGGDDLDKVVGDIRLAHASGAETYVPLGLPCAAENPRPGEIILYDTGNGDVFCRAWCWKNGDRSRIEETTRRVAVNVDAMPPVGAEEGRAAAEETAELVRRFCGGRVSIHRLSKDTDSLEL